MTNLRVLRTTKRETLLLLTLRRIRRLFRVRLFALATLTAAAVRALVGAMTAKRTPAYLRLGNLPYTDSVRSAWEARRLGVARVAAA